jgi:hypothetical protein
VNQKGRVFITRLDLNAEVLINDKSIPVGEPTALSLSDKLLLGGLPLVILRSYAKKDYTIVRRFQANSEGLSKLREWQKVLLIFIMGYFIGEPDSISSWIAVIVGTGFVTLIIFITGRLRKKISKGNEKLLIREVLIGKSGLTIHYKDTNISFKFSEIQHVYKKNNHIFIHFQDKKFYINFVDDLNDLYERILKKIPETARESQPKNTETKKLKKFSIACYGSLSLIVLSLFGMIDSMAKFDLIIAGTCFGLLVNMLVFQVSPFSLVASNNFRRNTKRETIMYICALGLMGTESYTSYKEVSKQEVNLIKCAKVDTKYCKEVDLNLMTSGASDSSRLKKKIIQSICKVDQKSCDELKSKYFKRSIASDNNSKQN